MRVLSRWLDYLSAEPVQSGSPDEWDREARRMVINELRNNTVIRAADRGLLTNQGIGRLQGVY